MFKILLIHYIEGITGKSVSSKLLSFNTKRPYNNNKFLWSKTFFRYTYFRALISEGGNTFIDIILKDGLTFRAFLGEELKDNSNPIWATCLTCETGQDH